MNEKNANSPVGANILPVDASDGLNSARKEGDWVIFGLAHTRLWTLQAYIIFIKMMQSRGVLKRILAVGPLGNKYAQQELDLANKQLGPDVLVQMGAVLPIELSKILLTSEAALVAQSSENLRKSGTFAALAAHAIPIICDVPINLQEPPGRSLFRPIEMMNKSGLLRTAESNRRRRQLHQWFWKAKSWKTIGINMTNWMKEG